MTDTPIQRAYDELSRLTQETTELLEQYLLLKSRLNTSVERSETAANNAQSSEDDARKLLQQVQALKQTIDTKYTDVIKLLNNAEAVVYGGGHSVEAKAGNVPIADANSKLAEGWLPDDWSQIDALLASIISQTGDILKLYKKSFAHTKEIEKLDEDFSSLATRNHKLANDLTTYKQHNNKVTQLLTYASWSAFETQANFLRQTFQSGVHKAQRYEYSGAEAYHLPASTGYSPYNGHSHGNWYNLVGTGKYSILSNGVFFEERHNDDGLYAPCQLGEDFDNRTPINAPAMPRDVAQAASKVDQVELIKKYIKVVAGQLPPSAVGDYANAARWVLTGSETYAEKFNPQQSLYDPFPGHRHQMNVDNYDDLLRQNAYLNSGHHKLLSENTVGVAAAVVNRAINGSIDMVLWRYRFISAVVGTLADFPATDVFDYYEDIINSARFGLSTEQMLSSRLCRFRVKQQLGKESDDYPFYSPTLLDQFIHGDGTERLAGIAGLDGYGNQLTEAYTYDGSGTLREYGTSIPLRAGYYNRHYSTLAADASNRNHAQRGFSDDKCWVARTTNPRIYAHQWGDQTLAHSYLVPVEMTLQSFLNGNANIYGIANVTQQYSRAQMNAMYASGMGQSKANPLPGYHEEGFYYSTPAELFSGSIPRDPADTTIAGGVWMRCADGVARQHYMSGYDYFWPTEGITGGLLRTRYPIYFATHEGSDNYKYLEAARREMCQWAAVSIGQVGLSLKQEKRLLDLEKVIATRG